MGTNVAVAEDEYLAMNFEGPFPDFIDGDLVVRTMPNDQHGETQLEIGFRFRQLRDDQSVWARTEIRLRVGPRRYRIADVAVFRQRPKQLIPELVPLVVVEIVSPNDTHEEIMARLRDFHALGVSHIWLADPGLRSLATYDGTHLTEVLEVEVPEIGLKLRLDEIILDR